ncbi:cytochrome P450 [Mycena latifolia]|nr:cytochrome P450 [Mycena latifolia]
MQSLDTTTILIYGLAALVCISWLRPREKSPIPAVVGSKGGIASYIPALRFLLHAPDVVHQGYYQYRDGVFRVRRLFRWDYVANGAQRIAEIAAAPESILSFYGGIVDLLQSDYTMGPEIARNPYSTEAVRRNLTRNLGRCFPDVRDEIVHAFDDVLALDGTEWKRLHVLPNIMQIVARTSNRIFVGLPLCREQGYLDLNISYTITIFTRGQLISFLPEFLKPILGPLIATRRSSVRQVLKFIGPLIEARLESEREHGRDGPDKPASIAANDYTQNDLISWLLQLAEGEERTVPALALRVLAVNMAAIHTSSMALSAVLFDLAAYPEHILPMREEAERVVAEEGWSKAALSNMHKIDSFIRESQRLTGPGAIAMGRKVVAKEGFTFSDGTRIPYGAILTIAGDATHYDPDNYENPMTFDGFRFSRLREQRAGVDISGEGTSFFNRHMVSTAQDHIVFGHGHHACPGRFFAATELKAMLAHVLINYDVKAETEGVRPPDLCIGVAKVPAPQGKIMIRKRV